MLMQAAATAAAPTPGAYQLAPADVFVLFFIMLGPLKSIGPFFVATREMEASALRALAFKVFAIAVAAVLLAGIVGSAMLRKWQISAPVMELAAGLVFLLVALQIVLAQYEPPAAAPPKADASLMHLVFPLTVTPYGIAALIVMMALSADMSRSVLIIAVALIVIVLDLLAMLFVRPIMKTIGMMPLQLLGAVLGILQVALALQIMHRALTALGYSTGGG